MSQIGLHTATGTRLPILFNGYTLNNPADTQYPAASDCQIDTVAGSTSFDYVSEVNQQRDGLEFYWPRRISRVETMRGVLRAPSDAELHDKIGALVEAMDPVQIAHDNDPGHDDPRNVFLPLDFSTPTADITNYPTGLVPSRYYALPIKLPDPIIDRTTGFAALFDISFLIRDPRRYAQALTTVQGSVTSDNSLAGVCCTPTLTVTMSSAGNAAFTVANTTVKDGAKSLVLDLSGCVNHDVVVVDFDRRSITKNGASFMSAYVSGSYWHIDPASNVIAFTNTGGTSNRVLTYRPAWSF